MKRTRVVAMAMACAMAVTALVNPVTAKADEFKWPKMVKLSITGSGTTAYAGTLAWANLLEGTGNTQVRLLPEDSNVTKFQRVKKGETLMTYDTNGDTATLIRATGGYATENGGPYQVRWVWPDFQSNGVMFVRGDSKIETVLDITKDTPIACTIDSAMENVKKSLAAAVGVGVDEMNWVYCSSYGEMPKLVTTGAAELCAYVTPQSSSLVEASAAPQGVRVMDFNPELYPEWCAAFQSQQVVMSFNEIAFGNEAAVGKHGWGSDGGWLCADTTDQDLIYNLVKFFAENQEDIQNAYETYSYYWSVDYARSTLDYAYIPIAEGTIRYFKELGMWTEKDDARQEYNVKLVDKYIAAYADCIAKAKADGIKIDVENDEWHQYWADYKTELGIPDVKIMSDEEIAEALAAGF